MAIALYEDAACELNEAFTQLAEEGHIWRRANEPKRASKLWEKLAAHTATERGISRDAFFRGVKRLAFSEALRLVLEPTVNRSVQAVCQGLRLGIEAQPPSRYCASEPKGGAPSDATVARVVAHDGEAVRPADEDDVAPTPSTMSVFAASAKAMIPSSGRVPADATKSVQLSKTSEPRPELTTRQQVPPASTSAATETLPTGSESGLPMWDVMFVVDETEGF